MSFGGTSGNDTHTGDAANNVIFGLGGNDSLAGAGGNDIINGGNDNDTLLGDPGNDTLLSESGDDLVFGGSDDDSLAGTAGADTLFGEAGQDTLSGGDQNDYLDGGTEADTLDGGNNADTLLGGDGNDSLVGSNGDDSLVGGDGNDTLSGGQNNDILVGGGGIDNLSGNEGNDTIFTSGGELAQGGDGNDLLVGGGTGNNLSGGVGTDSVTFSTPGTYTFTSVGGGAGYTVTGPGGSSNFVFNSVENVQINTGATVSIASVIAGGGSVLVCFAAGTRILTAAGEVAVERLKAGDLVATLSGRGSPMKPVLWLGRRRVVLAGHPNADAIAPVRIKAGALGQGAPHRDLLVSPDHCLFLDGALVPARLLVNGRNIVAERGLAEVTYYHVELESHDVLMAEGAAAESWLDCDNRAWFENAPVAQFAVAGTLAEAGSGWDANRACAPLLHGGEKLAAIRDAIAAQAAADVRRAAA
jgi:Ca2+-binding RTX toxin-like protein